MGVCPLIRHVVHGTVTPLFVTFSFVYGRKLTVDHGRLALHAILGAAKYSYDEDRGFHPPMNPLRIVVTLGRLLVGHWRILRGSLYISRERMIRSRDDSGKLPIHIACRSKAPVEVLAWLTSIGDTLHARWALRLTIRDHVG